MCRRAQEQRRTTQRMATRPGSPALCEQLERGGESRGAGREKAPENNASGQPCLRRCHATQLRAARGHARPSRNSRTPADRETDRRVNKATLDAKANGVCTVQKHTRQLEWPAMQLSFARREGTRDPAETVARQQTERPKSAVPTRSLMVEGSQATAHLHAVPPPTKAQANDVPQNRERERIRKSERRHQGAQKRASQAPQDSNLGLGLGLGLDSTRLGFELEPTAASGEARTPLGH